MFVVYAYRLPKSVKGLNGNDNYLPKEELMGEWMAIPTKTKDGFFGFAVHSCRNEG